MPDISEILNIYEIQRHYFKMETPFDREVVPVLPEKYEYHLRYSKKKIQSLNWDVLKLFEWMALSGPSPKVMTLFLTLYLNAVFPSASARLKMIMVCP